MATLWPKAKGHLSLAYGQALFCFIYIRVVSVWWVAWGDFGLIKPQGLLPILWRSPRGRIVVDALVLEIANDLLSLLDGGNSAEFTGAVGALSDVDLKDFCERF